MKEMQKEIDELKQDEQEEWKPQQGEQYWYYNKDTENIRAERWFDWTIDNTHLKNGVIFKTEQEAQRYADYQKAKREYSYGFSRDEWEDDNVKKWNIFYDYRDKTLQTSYNCKCRDMSKTHFKTEAQAHEICEKSIYRKKLQQLETKEQNLINKLQQDNESDNAEVKKLEEKRRTATSEYYRNSYQTQIHKLNAKIEIRKEILKDMKGEE